MTSTTKQPTLATANTSNLNEPVDMMATARAAQWSESGGWEHGAIKILSPAKVNLHLNVGSRRNDGYHEVVNVMHALALHDTLQLRHARTWMPGTPLPDPLPANVALAGPLDNVAVRIDCNVARGIAPLDVPTKDNLIFKAIDRLARLIDFTESDFIEVRVEKHIPHQGGLGGGSSNAAATLQGVARLWGLPDDSPAIREAARSLGADVAFFLEGGCARFVGAGEMLDAKLQPQKATVVLVKPKSGVSTAAAYREFDAAPSALDESIANAAYQASKACEVPLENNLAAAAERLLPELAEVRAWMQERPGVTATLLCGSGATTFSLVESMDDALRMTAEAQKRGWWAHTSALSSLRAAIVPNR